MLALPENLIIPRGSKKKHCLGSKFICYKLILLFTILNQRGFAILAQFTISQFYQPLFKLVFLLQILFISSLNILQFIS